MLTVRIVAYWLVVLVLSSAVLETAARLISPTPGAEKTELDRLYASHYSQREMDRNLPLQQERQGGKCVTYRLDRLYWSQWWGFSAKRLDKDCAVKLFERYPIKVVLLGGSAMYNGEAPNYLTHLDYFAFGGDERIASINLAESSARLSNMLARFVHEVLALRPDVVVFMDGFNEFNSVRYGGEPGNDFYWTAGVRRRIESPIGSLVDKLVEVSALFRIMLVNTGIHHSPREPQDLRVPPDHRTDAQIYLRDREVLNTICAAYTIKCVFILQPSAFTTSVENENIKQVVATHTRFFPRDAVLFRNGYAEIRRQPCPNCIDASDLLANINDAFFDVVHFTKPGGEKLGAVIHEAVIAATGKRKTGKTRKGNCLSSVISCAKPPMPLDEPTVPSVVFTKAWCPARVTRKPSSPSLTKSFVRFTFCLPASPSVSRLRIRLPSDRSEPKRSALDPGPKKVRLLAEDRIGEPADIRFGLLRRSAKIF